MRKMFFIAVVMCAMLTTVSCKKEIETIIERVEVQKGNLILSGIGAPDASLGNVGDYYLDLSNSYLYGAKTAQGWGLPISLKGIQGDKGDKGDKGDTGANGQKGDKGEKGDKGDTGANGQKGDKGDKGDTGATGQKGDKGDKGDTGANGANGQKGDKGEKGDKGDTGANGQKGEQGIPGQNGSKIYAGKGMPTSNIGNIGDWYIDSENKRFYGPKGNGGWSNEYIDLKNESYIMPPSVPLKKEDFGTYPGLKGNNWALSYVDMNAYEWLKTVGSIEKRGFRDFYYLKTFIFSDNVHTIKDEAFFQCHGLENIIFPKNLQTIGKEAFYRCTNLRSVILPDTVTEVGLNAFAYCGNLKTVKLSENMTQLKNNIFVNCYSLKSITIPKKIAHMGIGNFYGCSSLKTITFERTDPPAYEYKWPLDNVDNLETIYVPKESVEKYKNSSGFRIYKDKIKALP